MRLQLASVNAADAAEKSPTRSLFNPEGTVMSVQAMMASRVDYVCEQQIYYTKKIEAEKRRLADSERRILRAKTAILQRRKQIAAFAHESNLATQAVRNLGKLENKLSLLVVKNNLCWKANAAAKHKVDNLRREKIQQMRATSRLDRDIAGKKAKITTLITETQQMLDKKDRTQREIEVMKGKVLDELDANNAEYEALKQELSINQLTTTGGAAGARTTKKLGGTSNLSPSKDPAEGDMTKEEEEAVVSNINKAYWAIAKKKMDIQKQADKIHELVDDFKYLSEQTEVPSVESLIPLLLSSEEENFRLFDVTNEYNRELEELEVQKGEIRSEINKFLKIEAKQNSSKTQIKRELEDQIERAMGQASKCDSKYNVDVETIQGIAPTVINIFNKVGCSDEALTSQLLTNGVNDRNIMKFMAVIEQRIGEIVQLFNTTQKHGIVSHFEGLLVDPTRPPTPTFDQKGKRVAALSAPTLPSHTDFDNIDGEDDDDNHDDGGGIMPINTSKLHDMVARDTRANRLGGGGKSKLSIGFKGKQSKASLARLNTNPKSKGSSYKSLH
jgi:hypothetical protein